MRILVIEDEPGLRSSLSQFLRSEHYVCDLAGTYAEAMAQVQHQDYDCIILDINLPGGSGLDLLRHIRAMKKADGVIMISARDKLEDKVAGLDLGADDYLTKPFHMSELNARLKALLRRKYTEGSPLLDLGDVRIDPTAREADVNGKMLALSPMEFDLLVFLCTNRNRVVSRQAIAEHLYDGPAGQVPDPEFVYSHIKNLKRKLREAGSSDHIQTTYGLGYKWT
jgi:DNA-binding response OmpR family regulator